MAKHFYHIPLQRTLQFIKENKSQLNSIYHDKKQLAYYKELGKSYFALEVEKFIEFFKIDSSIEYAVKSLEYFNSLIFVDELYKILNFSQFKLEDEKFEKKSFFYAFCYLYAKRERDEFELFFQKTFLHYHTSFNQNSNIEINHKEICHALAKSKQLTLKESFGEDDDGGFFKLLVDEEVVIDEKGNRIKSLRKKAYKKMMKHLLDVKE